MPAIETEQLANEFIFIDCIHFETFDICHQIEFPFSYLRNWVQIANHVTDENDCAKHNQKDGIANGECRNKILPVQQR